MLYRPGKPLLGPSRRARFFRHPSPNEGALRPCFAQLQPTSSDPNEGALGLSSHGRRKEPDLNAHAWLPAHVCACVCTDSCTDSCTARQLHRHMRRQLHRQLHSETAAQTPAPAPAQAYACAAASSPEPNKQTMAAVSVFRCPSRSSLLLVHALL